MNWIIRHAVPDDCPAILQLIKDLAVYAREQESVVTITPEVLQRDCFGKDQWFHCLVAEQEVEDDAIQNKTSMQSNTNKKLVGYAMFYHAYSPWNGRMLYLEDLYVAPSSRRNGIGTAFLTKLSQIAIQKGCYKIHWIVYAWNQLAIDFYTHLGAEIQEEWKSVVFDNSAMTKLANKGN